MHADGVMDDPSVIRTTDDLPRIRKVEDDPSGRDDDGCFTAEEGLNMSEHAIGKEDAFGRSSASDDATSPLTEARRPATSAGHDESVMVFEHDGLIIEFDEPREVW